MATYYCSFEKTRGKDEFFGVIFHYAHNDNKIVDYTGEMCSNKYAAVQDAETWFDEEISGKNELRHDGVGELRG